MSSVATLHDDVDDIGGVNSTVYSDAKKSRAFTRWAHIINEEVADAMSDYDFQGEKSTASLVANQREYRFPIDLLKIKLIHLKLDGSNWKPANFMDESEAPSAIPSEADIIAKFSNSDPFVSLFDKSFFIWSGTIIAVTGGILLWYDKDIVGVDTNGADITSFSADTDSPNLIEFAQQALVYGAILDFYTGKSNQAKIREMNIKLYGNSAGRPADARLIGGIIKQIRDYYTNVTPDRQMSISTPYDESDFN